MKQLLSSVLLLALSSVAVVQDQVEVSLHVVVIDELQPRPVALTDFRATGSPTGPVTQRTDAEGKLTFRLAPGKYRIESVQPVPFRGKAYTWSKEIDVNDRTPLSISWTQADAESTDIQTGRQVSAEAKLYQRFKGSVATIYGDSSKGSGFLVDSNRGLILTNSHVVSGSLNIAASFSETEKYDAVVVVDDPRLDLAVLAVHPDAVAGKEALPIVPSGSALGVEGERIVAIGSPLQQERTLTLGIISKVEKDILLSDVAINPGNSGGPILNGDGHVIGVATFADPGRGTPGLGGIVSIRLAEPLIGTAVEKAAGVATSSARLPVVSQTQIPDEMISQQAEKIKKDFPFLASPRNFRTYLLTPFDVAAAEVRYQKELQKKISRRYKGKVPPEQAAGFGPSGFWQKYVSRANDPLVTFQVLPWPKQTSGSIWGQVLFGTLAGPAKLELRDDFLRMELYRNGELVQPVRRGRVRDTQIYLSYNIELNDTAMAGIYSYDPRTFKPGAKVEVRVWKNDGKSATTFAVPESHLKRIWGMFEDWDKLDQRSQKS